MFSQILIWCLMALGSYFFQFGLICLSPFFLFLQIEFLFPLLIIQNSFGDKVSRSLLQMFLSFNRCCPVPGFPLVRPVGLEMVAAQVGGNLSQGNLEAALAGTVSNSPASASCPVQSEPLSCRERINTQLNQTLKHSPGRYWAPGLSRRGQGNATAKVKQKLVEINVNHI